MKKIKPRPTQTKIKHEILKKYLKGWAGIITHGLINTSIKLQKSGVPFQLHLVYIDCNASFGRYNGELEDEKARRKLSPVFGSPIIGIQTLDEFVTWAKTQAAGRAINRMEVKTNSILIEKDSNVFTELKKSLELAGLSDRVQETINFNSLKNGEIAIVNADCTQLISEVLNYTQSGNKFSLFFIDPYGPLGIPLNFIQKVITKNKQDAIIYMPYQDLFKKHGYLVKDNFVEGDRKVITNYNAVFGHTKWQEIVRNLYSEQPNYKISGPHKAEKIAENNERRRQLEIQLMESYKESLQSLDPTLAVKSIGLHFPSIERTMYYLYLTTHNASGAFKMNEILAEEGLHEIELRWNLREISETYIGDAIQPRLFDFETPNYDSSRPSPEAIADFIYNLFKSQNNAILLRDANKVLADEIFFASEIRKAFDLLKKENKMSWQGVLSEDTFVTFY